MDDSKHKSRNSKEMNLTVMKLDDQSKWLEELYRNTSAWLRKRTKWKNQRGADTGNIPSHGDTQVGGIMNLKTEIKDISNIIVDIEEKLRHSFGSNQLEAVFHAPLFEGRFEEILRELGKENNLELQRYVDELLEKSGPKRRSGKVDTRCFYENACISAATWSNFINGKFTPETILKIIAGLECNMEEAEQVLRLAGMCLTNSFRDRLVKAAILSGHNNTPDMYTILEYYSKQYPKEIKNYYRDLKS